MYFKYTFSFLLLLCSFFILEAQQFFFKNYSLEQGLVQSQVNDIGQDQDGFLWVCTNGGVSRFDGQHFINFSVLDGLTDNQVITVTIDSRNQIWFGTLGALCLKDKEKFVPFALPNTHQDAYILNVQILSDTILWVGTDKNGILEFNTISKTFNLLQGTDTIQLVRDLYQDSEKKIWACSKSGVYFQNNLNQWIKKAIPCINEEIKPSSIVEYKKDHFLISTFGQGIIEIKPLGVVLFSENSKLVSNSIRRMVQIRDGRFWFFSKAGVSVWDQVKVQNYTTNSGMPNPSSEVLFEDIEGNYWIGTDGKGLLRFTGEEIKTYSTRSGFCSDLPMAFCEDKNGMNVGTYDQGLCELKERTTYPKDSENRIWDLYIDRRGWMWKATSKGIEVIGKNANKSSALVQLTSKGVNCIKEDTDGDIWLGVRQGIILWNSGNNEAKQISGIGDRIRAISMFNNQVWTGSNQGLFCIQKHADSLKKELVLPPFNQGKNEITCLLATQHVLWIGTTYGLYFYEIQSKKIDLLYLSSSYSSNVINSLVLDDIGDVWCGTNFGIFCIRSSDVKISFFDTEDGLPSLECNQNAAYKDSKGDLWFGTAGGICVIDPTIFKKNHLKAPPKTQYLGMRLFMQQTTWTKYDSKIDPFIPEGIKLSHDKNHLTFDFVGMYFHNPTKVFYKHRLLGFEEFYSTPHQNSFVSYSNISPGKYTFELISSHDLIIWSKPKIISFEISPPFWLQSWFIILCVFMFLLLGYGVHLFRSYIRKKKIEAQNLSYQTRLLELEQQALNASMNRHFVFNSLNSIQYFINAEDKKSANTYLTKFAKLIRKNLDDLQNEHVPLEEEIERMKLYLSLEEMRFEGSFEYQINVDSSLDIQKIAIPTMILQPFVENSIIHGILPQQKPGKIKIEISLVGRIVLFVIEDNGIGFDTSMEQKNIQKNTHVSKGMSITRERLNVLRKVYQNEEIEVLGPIEIKNEQGESEGTRVKIKLPFINLQTH